MMTLKGITARAKAFSGEGIRQHKFALDTAGTVRVWDAIAGYYTRCHAMSKATESRIRNLAKGGQS